MPSVVCESTSNVNVALLESLGDGAVSVIGDAKAAATSNSAQIDSSGCDGDPLQNKLAASAKRLLMTKVEYEEVNNYGQSVLDTLKSKYTVIKPTESQAAASVENGRNTTANCNRQNNDVGVNAVVYNGSSLGTSAIAGVNGAAAANSSATSTQLANRQQQQQQPNELPQPNHILYPRENIRTGWHNVMRKMQVGAGMFNFGNTCYMNSTLQALFHVPSVVSWLLSEYDHMAQCNVGETGCIICAMVKTLLASQTNSSPLHPIDIYSKLRIICKSFVAGRQEDAHEFLRHLVNCMEKAYLCRFRYYRELDQYSKETTPLNQILGGYMRTAVRCPSCHHLSVTFQHFQDLLVDIRNVDTIEAALDGYFSREHLEDMGYKCDGCKKKVSATKQFSLEQPPVVLCIQLKRFSMLSDKITKPIQIKLRLELTKYLTLKNNTEPLMYRLMAMITHLGSTMNCGHYTAIGLHESGSYYMFDDSYVRPVTTSSIANTNAYIMFYELERNSQRLMTSTIVTDTKENYQKVNGYAHYDKNNNNNGNGQRIIGPLLPNSCTTPNASKTNFLNEHENRKGNVLTAFRKTNRNSGGDNVANNNINIHNNTAAAASTTTPNNNNNNNINSNNSKSKIVIHFKNKSAKAVSIYKSTTNGNGNGIAKPCDTRPAAAVSEKKHNGDVHNNSSYFSDPEDDVSSSNNSNSIQSTLPSMPTLGEATNDANPMSTSKTSNNSNNAANEKSACKKYAPRVLVKKLAANAGTDSDEPKRMKLEKDQTPPANGTSSHDRNNYKYHILQLGFKRRIIDLTNSSNGSSKATPKRSHKHAIYYSDNEAEQTYKRQSSSNGDISKISVKKRAKSNSPTCTNQKTSNSPSSIDKIFEKSKKTIPTNNHKSTDNNNEKEKEKKKKTQSIDAATATASTPPSSPINSTTGVWQVEPVEALKPEATITPTTKMYKNPFANETTSNAAVNKHKREKTARKTVIEGNGYTRETAGESAVDELLQQTSHRGYGESVLSWSGGTNDIDQEILQETREQRQREWEDEEETEMDRGRQKKVKTAAKNANKFNTNDVTPGFNPFQEEQEMQLQHQRRWKHFGHNGGIGGGGGGGNSYAHNAQSRTHFQRRKFKFQRFNNRFQFQRHRTAGYKHQAGGNNQNNS